jgi:hypothetical protein
MMARLGGGVAPCRHTKKRPSGRQAVRKDTPVLSWIRIGSTLSHAAERIGHYRTPGLFLVVMHERRWELRVESSEQLASEVGVVYDFLPTGLA